MKSAVLFLPCDAGTRERRNSVRSHWRSPTTARHRGSLGSSEKVEARIGQQPAELYCRHSMSVVLRDRGSIL